MIYAKRINLETGEVKNIYKYPVETKNNFDEERGYIVIDENEYISLQEQLLNKIKPTAKNSNSAERDEVIDIENDD